MRQTAVLLAGIIMLGKCEGPSITGATASAKPTLAVGKTSARVGHDLATLRRVTAPFHDFATAKAAGWSAQITGCMTDPTAGGMGFHYGNVALIDANVRVDEPELLLYEPERNGRMRLVAVEYIVPYTARSRSDTPPVLFGQEFTRNDTFQLWGLHVWAWKHNPSGIYASWNPAVGCDGTADVLAMAHD